MIQQKKSNFSGFWNKKVFYKDKEVMVITDSEFYKPLEIKFGLFTDKELDIYLDILTELDDFILFYFRFYKIPIKLYDLFASQLLSDKVFQSKKGGE